MVVYLNGRYLPPDEAKLSIEDRGFLFGDGVYDVIRSVNGHLFERERHLQRLAHGMEVLRLAASPALMGDIAQQLLNKNDLLDGQATIYLQITRGAAPRTHHFPPPETPLTTYVSAARFHPRSALVESGAGAITHADLRWQCCDLKTVNLLPNVLAKQKAVDAGAAEAILIRDGIVTEGTSTTVFGVIDGELRTHPNGPAILPGITRAVIIELAAEQGLRINETPMRAMDLSSVSELFLAGTTTDILPIVRMDGRPVGAGRPGPIARGLAQALARRLTASGIPNNP